MANCYNCHNCGIIDISGDPGCTVDSTHINILGWYYHRLFGCKHFKSEPEIIFDGIISDENINKHISLSVCIDGVILYGDFNFDADGNRTGLIVYPITHCRDFREVVDGEWVGDPPSPICDTGCPQKCPFNDWDKEQKILDDYGNKLEQCLMMIEKRIYG